MKGESGERERIPRVGMQELCERIKILDKTHPRPALAFTFLWLEGPTLEGMKISSYPRLG